MPLPVTGTQPDVCYGTMFFGYKGFGWSETYVLNNPSSLGSPVPTLLDAKGQLALGCSYRAFLLGLGAAIIGARVSHGLKLRDSLNAIEVPIAAKKIDAEVAVEKINSVEAAVLLRFDDLLGKYSLRQLRGLRDSWVTDHEMVGAFFLSNPSPDTAYATVIDPALFTATEAVTNFLLWMKQNTVIAKKTGEGATLWTTYPLISNSFRKVSNRQTGRPFGQSRGRAPTFA